MATSTSSPGWSRTGGLRAEPMPPGVPVATMAVGKAGARNAAVFAAQVLALADPALAARLDRFKGEQADAVAEQSRQLREQLAPGGGA